MFAGPGGDGLAAIEIASQVHKAKVYAACDSESSAELFRGENMIAHNAINGRSLTKVYKSFDSFFQKKKIKTVYDGTSCAVVFVAYDL